MQTLFLVVPVVAVAAWVFAVVNALLMLRHRDGTRSLGWLAFHGHAFFTRTGFSEEARPAHRRFLIGTGAFFVVVLVGIAFAAVAGR